MAKLDMKTRNKIFNDQRVWYKKAAMKEKCVILDSVCLTTGVVTTGLSRDRAKKLSAENPKRPPVSKSDRSGRNRKYGQQTREALKTVWALMGFTGGKRLCAGMEDMLSALVRFVECGLVAHCGATTAGEYVNTLDVTDIKSGRTETRAVINKAPKHVFDALMAIGSGMPFAIPGIDSDNGSGFINHHLYRYCMGHRIVFTRSRPYMKNDGCHVEQKNWHIVRRHIGYGRYEGRDAVRIMNEYYALLRLYTNFFSPQTKLVSKQREGSRFVKRCDDPKTPYRRLLADDAVTDGTKNRLNETFLSLNPAAMKRDMIKVLGTLMKLAVPS